MSAGASLEVRGLTFGYPAVAPLFSEWNASFGPGELVAITGASGRGKSTLLYLMALMVRPAAGEIRFRGERVDQLRDSERAHLRAESVGFVFQDATLDASRTVLDNVLESCLYRGVSRGASIQHARDLLSRFGVEQRAEHRPGQISGGQAQRIALCRALMNDPGILFADEPTGNLDRASADTVLAAFRERAAAGSTVIVATHDPSLVTECDRTMAL
ncbi:ABC transporter ATP-binding protein [Subtercola sp. RTI3]|uniref:ABC transporter ATP-binding protein n=1 Tax=Subtercola sp. RTI3 TaxID=3048639 RepID=UPI002B230B99|nr:ATP-binding cassette domain-containing protein [Subtercola sp. RTI3]MEA9986012.1 ATP-binding cassette domain-containing protein [Subtercola sp. RTI3]